MAIVNARLSPLTTRGADAAAAAAAAVHVDVHNCVHARSVRVRVRMRTRVLSTCARACFCTQNAVIIKNNFLIKKKKVL